MPEGVLTSNGLFSCCRSLCRMYRRLTDEHAIRRARDVLFLHVQIECDQQIQIEIAQFRHFSSTAGLPFRPEERSHAPIERRLYGLRFSFIAELNLIISHGVHVRLDCRHHPARSRSRQVATVKAWSDLTFAQHAGAPPVR